MQVSSTAVFKTLLTQELKVGVRSGFNLIVPVIFFLLVSLLFPLGLNPSAKVLLDIGPGLIWVSAILSMLLTLDGLFQADREEGVLEQLLTMQHLLWPAIFAKLVGYFILYILPIVFTGPLVALFLGFSWYGIKTLFISMLLGMPILALLGAIGNAITTALQNRGGLILGLLMLPLYVPVLIFATSAIIHANQGWSPAGELALMGALLLLSAALAPAAIRAALKMSYM